VEVIVHDTPTEKLNTREFRHTTHHLNEIIPFLIAEKENAMRNAVHDVMDSKGFPLPKV